jgi:antitoxin CptB
MTGKRLTFGALLSIYASPGSSGLLAFEHDRTRNAPESLMTQRSSEGLDARRRRLLFRAWRRGVREMDLIMGRFADAYIEKFDEPALDDFEILIEAPNAELYAWVVGDAAAPARYDTEVLRQLIGFHAERIDPKAGEER